MTREREEHLIKICDEFFTLINAKYRRGAAEHEPGNLLDKSSIELLKEARAETIDQFVYLQTAIDKIESEEKYAAPQ